MSYGLRIAGDAIADLKALDPWLQEEVLDELETLAVDPSRLRPDSQGRAVHDFDRSTGGTRQVVFLRMHCDDHRSVLTVVAIVARPA